MTKDIVRPEKVLVERIETVKKIEYQGERVVTLSMVDELHERPSGTAGRNFRQHRGKLLEGADFFEIPVDEIRRLGIKEHGGGSNVVLLTESGYLMLVKSFRDDLAWQVQRALVSHYFRSTQRLDSSHLEYIGKAVARGIEEGFRETRGEIKEEFKATNGKIDVVDGKVEDLARRVDRIERRRNLTPATKRMHIDTIVAFFGGKCPCCGVVEVVDSFGNALASSNYDHWESKSKNKPHQTWLVCSKCNFSFENDPSFKANSLIKFDFFQSRREQKHYPLLGPGDHP